MKSLRIWEKDMPLGKKEIFSASACAIVLLVTTISDARPRGEAGTAERAAYCSEEGVKCLKTAKDRCNDDYGEDGAELLIACYKGAVSACNTSRANCNKGESLNIDMDDALEEMGNRKFLSDL